MFNVGLNVHLSISEEVGESGSGSSTKVWASRGDSHLKVTRMLVGKFKLNPLMGIQCGCGSSLNGPLREISLWSVSGHFL